MRKWAVHLHFWGKSCKIDTFRRNEERGMKKCLSALLALCMTAMLAGCMCETAETVIKADGSGTVKATFGYSERFVEACKLVNEMNQEGFTRFALGGKTYYGDTAEETFADPAAFNEFFSDSAAEMKASGSELNMGTLTLEKTVDGDLTLTLVCDGNTGSADAMARALKQEGKVSDSDLTALREDLVMQYSFTFPKDVSQTSGSALGVTIAGGKLDIDLTKLSAGTYVFTTAAQGRWTVPVLEPTNLPDQGTVCARTQNIDIDGKTVTFKTYAVVVPTQGGGTLETNYVKLRDVAYAMNGTAAQFNVDWDGDVLIVPHSAYVVNGSEMSTPFTGDRAYKKAASATRVNGEAVPFSAILLTDNQGGGYTYYKLRDLGQVLGFDVSWSVERGIYIDSDKPYTAD